MGARQAVQGDQERLAAWRQLAQPWADLWLAWEAREGGAGSSRKAAKPDQEAAEAEPSDAQPAQPQAPPSLTPAQVGGGVPLCICSDQRSTFQDL